MKKNFSNVLATAGVLGCGLFFSTGTASASVVGTLFLDGGTVTVSASNLFWTGPAFVQVPPSTLTYGSGTAVPNATQVTLQGLPGSLPIPINDFMSFSGIPSLDFVLDTAGPGSLNTDCSATGLAANSGNCSAFAGAPIVLSQGTLGTLASLGVSGTASDGSSPPSAWFGEFSETITSLTGYSGIITPLELQTYFGGPSSPNANQYATTYSGTFTVTLTPEPSSILLTLMGSGLILLAAMRRRRSS